MLEAISKGEVIFTKQPVVIGSKFQGKPVMHWDENTGEYAHTLPPVNTHWQGSLIRNLKGKWETFNKYAWGSVNKDIEDKGTNE